MGVQQSRGWMHYAIHQPEPHIMLFRCARNPAFLRERAPMQEELASDPVTGA